MGGTNIFKVLADGQRREILMMLKDGRLNAGEIITICISFNAPASLRIPAPPAIPTMRQKGRKSKI